MKRIALIQMTSSQKVSGNLTYVADQITRAADSKSEVVFLPENFACLGSPNTLGIADSESSATGPIRYFLSAQAREHGIWIVGGTVPVGNRPDGTGVPGRRARAACFVFDSNGAEVARYDKIHMFDVKVEDNHKNYVESETFEPGDELVVIQSPIGKLGLSVCYDIRFPEMYRSLLHQGAEIISIPSAFTRVTGEAHWRALARARAIENSCFVIGACQWGKHDSGRETWGESLVVDPWGKVVEVMDNGTGLLLAELDLNLVRSIRADMPIESQTRLNISAPVHNRGNQPFEYPS